MKLPSFEAQETRNNLRMSIRKSQASEIVEVTWIINKFADTTF